MAAIEHSSSVPPDRHRPPYTEDLVKSRTADGKKIRPPYFMQESCEIACSGTAQREGGPYGRPQGTCGDRPSREVACGVRGFSFPKQTHTACRFAEKTRFFRSLLAGRRCAAASRFSFFKGETFQGLLTLFFHLFQINRKCRRHMVLERYLPHGLCPL